MFSYEWYTPYSHRVAYHGSFDSAYTHIHSFTHFNMQVNHCLFLPLFLSHSADNWHSPGDGGSVCLPSRPTSSLGGVPEQVLRRRWIQIHAVLLRGHLEGRR